MVPKWSRIPEYIKCILKFTFQTLFMLPHYPNYAVGMNGSLNNKPNHLDLLYIFRQLHIAHFTGFIATIYPTNKFNRI